MARIVGLAPCALTMLLFLAQDPRGGRRWGPGRPQQDLGGQGHVPALPPPGNVRPLWRRRRVRRPEKGPREAGRTALSVFPEWRCVPAAAGQAAQPVGRPVGVRGRAPEAESAKRAGVAAGPGGLAHAPHLPDHWGVHAEEGPGGQRRGRPGAESRGRLTPGCVGRSPTVHQPQVHLLAERGEPQPAPREVEDPLQLLRVPPGVGPQLAEDAQLPGGRAQGPALVAHAATAEALSGVLGGRRGLSGPRQGASRLPEPPVRAPDGGPPEQRPVQLEGPKPQLRTQDQSGFR